MYELTKSIRNADLLFKDGFMYRKNYASRLFQWWRCIDSQCTVTVSTNLNYIENKEVFSQNGEHNHNNHNEKFYKAKKTSEMKEKIKLQHLTPIREIICSSLQGENVENLSYMGNPESISRTLRNFKESIINPPPIIFPTLKLSEKLCKTVRNESFYRYGPDNYRGFPMFEGILLFFSDSLVEKLYENNVWCVDGTFDVVPNPYFQLYTISFIKSNHVFPSIFALLMDKKQETYNNLFTLIFLMKGRAYPSIIKCDYEIAALNSLNMNFPLANISGCSFHLGQSIQRKLKEFGIFQFYKNNERVKKFIKGLIALSYVRKSEIRNTFEELKLHQEFPEICLQIYNYFYNNYIGSLEEENNVRFPINIWHASESLMNGLPRTNNAIEGWHNAFSSSFLNTKHSFTILIDRLRNEEENIQQKLIWNALDYNPPTKRKYENMVNNLRQYILQNERDYGLNYVFSIIRLIFY